MRLPQFIRYGLKSSFAKYGYTSEKERIRPFVLRLGLCFSLTVGVLLVGAGMKIVDHLAGSERKENAVLRVKSLLVPVGSLSPVRPVRDLLKRSQPVEKRRAFETFSLPEEPEFKEFGPGSGGAKEGDTSPAAERSGPNR